MSQEQSETAVGRRAFTMLGIGGLAAGATVFAAAPAAHADPPESMRVFDSVAAARAAEGEEGEVAYLLGYHASAPGVGGGMLRWDDADESADDGGLVFAVDGVSTGRWRRPVADGAVPLAWFGVLPDPDTDQASAIQAAVNALPDGGILQFGTGVFRIASTITVTTAPVTFVGTGAGDGRDSTTGAEFDLGTQLRITTGDQDAFVLRGVRGGGFRDLQMRGDVDAEGIPTLTGGAFIRTDKHPDDPDQGNYFLSFYACRFKEGYNGIVLRGCNTVRFQHCVWNGFRGEQVVLLNGVGDAFRADPIEFVQCAISAGTKNRGTDNVVLDGLGGSIKFISTAILFGRHGIWMRNTTGSASLPKFLYFNAGGFENSHGYPVLLEAGADAKFSNTYISTDGLLDCVRITNGFTGTAMFADVVVRGAGRNGIDIDSTRIVVTGSVIGNNGRAAHPDFAIPISAAASGADVRIETATPHGWETGDYVSVTGTGGAAIERTWRITVIDDTHFDLPGASLGGYGGGGSAYRHGAGINIRGNATRVVITGNSIGGLPEGANRQRYGIVSDAQDVLIATNDLNGNLEAPYALNALGPASRVTDNKGIAQLDGWFACRIPGSVANGEYDFSELLYLDGRRVLVLKIIRSTGAGSAKVRMLVDGDPAGSAAITASTSTGATTLSAPFGINGLSSPRRLRLRVSDASGAEDLTVQFAYQLVG
ncbi:hypothetical protein PYV02_02625 [Leifsonia sp. H3M29-4]|uniref:hypothetical protein n=1 Tax=Salinibacterium metalliresistens TaxID=3031321 RepID=UPI0023D9AD98|nr:hypothetical protein [Salinibacterium metalliresistens]MDF1477974.1 hypothetical protein [Salinibacterium metalliresistens]